MTNDKGDDKIRYPSGISPLNNVYHLWVSAKEIEGFIRARLILNEYESILKGEGEPTWVSSDYSVKMARDTLRDIIERGVGHDKD